MKQPMYMLTALLLCSLAAGSAVQDPVPPRKVVAGRNWLQSGITVFPPRSPGGGKKNAPGKIRLKNVEWRGDLCGTLKHPQALADVIKPGTTLVDLANKCLKFTWEVTQAGKVVPQDLTSWNITKINGAPAGRRMVLQVASGTCPILDLVLGPLNLDLLGLVVNLNQVVLNIAAQSGAGNLLGNLLCAVANLLNPGGLGLSELLQGVISALQSLLGGLNLG